MSEVLRIDQSLNKATREYANYDSRIKALEAKKKKARDKFFELATKKLSKRKAVRRTEEFVETNEMLADEYVARFFPAYKLEGFAKLDPDPNDPLPDGHTRIRATLVEDPAKAKFTFVNKEEGKVFGRTYEMRGAGFDTTGLVSDHPELAKRCVILTETLVSQPGNWVIDEEGPIGENPTDINLTYALDEKLADKIMSEEPETVRIFQQYANPGNLNVKIAPVRAAKEEELNG